MIATFTSGIELMGKGGVMMYPIFLASIIAFAIIIERIVFFKKCKENPDDIFAAIKDLAGNGKQIDAADIHKSTEGPVSRILEVGVQARKEPRWKLEEKLTVHGQEEIRELRKNLRGLEVIATISPLMGLLGTVVGMELEVEVDIPEDQVVMKLAEEVVPTMLVRIKTINLV